MTMARENWELHKARYRESYSHLSITDYAKEMGINPNTARRAMAGVADQGKAKEGEQKGKGDQKSDRSKGDQGKSDRKSDRAITSGKVIALSGTPKAKTKKTIISKPYGSNKQRGQHARDQLAAADQKSQNSRPDDDILMLTRHAQDHTGGYVTYLGMDDDIRMAAEMLAMDDGDLMLSCGRYLQMERAQKNILAQIEEDYDAGKSWPYPGTETPMPRSVAIAQALISPSDRMTELINFIGRRKVSAARLRLDQHRAHPISAERQIAIVDEALDLREEKQLTALETAYLIERHGIRLPRALEAELLREVSLMEAKVEEGQGITDDELDVLARKYQEKMADQKGPWLKNRREEVQAAIEAELAAQVSDQLDEDEYADLPPPDWSDVDGVEPLTGEDDVPGEHG